MEGFTAFLTALTDESPSTSIRKNLVRVRV
jgi:hypothetical protein